MKNEGRKRKLTKPVIAAIVTAAICFAITAALLITDIFVPVRYLTAYFVRADGNREGTLRVSFIDAGFGDCTLVELPDGKTMLIDSGDGAYPNTLHVMRFLNSRGVDRLDYLVCTSVKDEHCGGFAEILKYKEVGYAFVPYCLNERITEGYRAFVSALKERGVEYGYAEVGEGIYDDSYGYYFTFLAPSNYRSDQSAYNGLNSSPDSEKIDAASAVSYLAYGETAFAFTSDIRADGLKDIIARYRASEDLNQPFCEIGGRPVKLEDIDIVTAAGHAGKNNTYAPWYGLIEPEQTVISVGKSYADYPSDEALSDICNYCQPYYTLYDGDITVTVCGGRYSVAAAKKQTR